MCVIVDRLSQLAAFITICDSFVPIDRLILLYYYFTEPMSIGVGYARHFGSGCDRGRGRGHGHASWELARKKCRVACVCVCVCVDTWKPKKWISKYKICMKVERGYRRQPLTQFLVDRDNNVESDMRHYAMIILASPRVVASTIFVFFFVFFSILTFIPLSVHTIPSEWATYEPDDTRSLRDTHSICRNELYASHDKHVARREQQEHFNREEIVCALMCSYFWLFFLSVCRRCRVQASETILCHIFKRLELQWTREKDGVTERQRERERREKWQQQQATCASQSCILYPST